MLPSVTVVLVELRYCHALNGRLQVWESFPSVCLCISAEIEHIYWSLSAEVLEALRCAQELLLACGVSSEQGFPSILLPDTE